MKIIFNKKEKRVIQLLRQLQYLHNELLSVDTEISFLNEASPDEYVEKLVKVSDNCRTEIQLTLDRIDLMSR